MFKGFVVKKRLDHKILSEKLLKLLVFPPDIRFLHGLFLILLVFPAMRILFLVSFICFCGSCALRGQPYVVYDDFSRLEARIQQTSSKKTLVINFWATWCAPCVEELPCFEELNRKYADSNVEVWLVSLDFKSRLEKQFIPFLEKKKLKSDVILLADQDADTWIAKMHPDWEGALPATVIIRNGQKAFHGEPFESFEDLEAFVLAFLKTVHKVTGVSSEGTR